MHIVPSEVIARHDHKVPNYIASTIRAIDFDVLSQAGVRHVVLDVDNTLVSFGSVSLHSHIGPVLEAVRATNSVLSVSLATNSRRDLSHIARAVGADYVFQPHGFIVKPLAGYFHAIIRQLQAEPNAIVMIGDRLIQDIWGARQVGMQAVLVRPLGRDLWLDRILLTRWRERRLLRGYLPHHPEHWF